jgi:pSer/pThr/pTyr-binding forkhead associated (FHA) protein
MSSTSTVTQHSDTPLAKLVCVSGPLEGTIFDITRHGLQFGREMHNDVVLLDDSSSKDHARIDYEGKRFYLSDLGSSNGSFVQGRRITRVQLMNGHVIRVGLSTFSFDGPGAEVKVPARVSPGGRGGGNTLVIIWILVALGLIGAGVYLFLEMLDKDTGPRVNAPGNPPVITPPKTVTPIGPAAIDEAALRAKIQTGLRLRAETEAAGAKIEVEIRPRVEVENVTDK